MQEWFRKYRDLSKDPTVELSREQLLELYLSALEPQRRELFVETARAAAMVGVSQRTIQVWIEVGSVKAIRVGKKYQVYLKSLREFLRARTNND